MHTLNSQKVVFPLKPNIVVLANGECPTHQIPLDMLTKAEKIICCDGAISFLEQINITPHIIIGDCDSVSFAQREKFQSLIKIEENDSYNDLQKAIKYCIEMNWDEITLLGASGLREDHFLANIGILMHYANRILIKLVTNYGFFIPILHTTTFESYPGQQVSIFSFSPGSEITYRGLKYSVYRRQFKELWEGSLNEAIADNFTVEVENNAALLVYLTF